MKNPMQRNAPACILDKTASGEEISAAKKNLTPLPPSVRHSGRLPHHSGIPALAWPRSTPRRPRYPRGNPCRPLPARRHSRGPPPSPSPASRCPLDSRSTRRPRRGRGPATARFESSRPHKHHRASIRFVGRVDDLISYRAAAEPGGVRGVDAALPERGGAAAQPQVLEAAHGHVHAPLPAQRLLLQALRARQGHAQGHQQGHRRRHHQRQGPPPHSAFPHRRQRLQDHREAHRGAVHGRRCLRSCLRA